jgi:hypothetical protein
MKKSILIILTLLGVFCFVSADRASAHPSEFTAKTKAKAVINRIADGAPGGISGSAFINKVKSHHKDGGRHYRWAYGGYKRRAGRRGQARLECPVYVQVYEGAVTGEVVQRTCHKPSAAAAGRRAIVAVLDPDVVDRCRAVGASAVSCRVRYRDGVDVIVEDDATGARSSSVQDVVFRVTASRSNGEWRFVA